MRAVRLVARNQPVQVRKVPVPQPRGDEVLVKIAGAGICHSDLHVIAREHPAGRLPMTLGHENAGWVEAIGEGAPSPPPGTAVAVYGAWSLEPDRFTRSGLEQLSETSAWAGVACDGGMAEYLLVPHARYLHPLQGLDPVEAAPLTDAGLTPYRAVKKLLPNLLPGSAVVIIGSGGLGQFALQYVRLLSPACRLIAVDISDAKLRVARRLGADLVLNARSDDVVAVVKDATDARGAQGVIDFVGSDATLRQAVALAGRRAKVVMVGLAGGTLKVPTSPTNEVEYTTSRWGSQAELDEVLDLARQGLTQTLIRRVTFDEVAGILRELEAGEVDGRAVLVPAL
jgi:propanol-preferring alcohol dehydrogenase